MKNNGSDLPVFKTDEDRSYFRVILPVHPAFLEKNEYDAKKSEVGITYNILRKIKTE